MKNILTMLMTVLSVGLMVAACNPPPAPGPAGTGTAAPTAAKADPQKDWDQLVADAKKEGTVTVYALWRPDTRQAVTDALKSKYGINVEFSPFSRGAELLAKVEAEQRAGLYLADLFGAGSNTMVSLLKPAGVLGPIEPLLVLPEAIDGKYWSTGRVPFVDKDKTFVAMISSLQRNIVYNTDQIKKGEITDYPDVLKPQYKGKITMNDPTVTGPGGDFMIHLAVNIWDLERAKDYLRQLIKQQDTVIERDNRIQVETVARGKYSIGIAPNPDNLATFLNLKAPLEAVIFKEGVRVTSAAGAFSLPKQLAHPKATKLFVNWLLTKEGQTVFSKGFGNPSLRNDVPTSDFNPIFLPQPGEKIFPDSEEFLSRTTEVLAAAKQVVDEANR